MHLHFHTNTFMLQYNHAIFNIRYQNSSSKHYIDHIERGMGSLKFNKYVFFITTIVAYTLTGFIPAFRIKLAPPIEMSLRDGRLYYFFQNFVHNWGFKIIIAFIIAAIASAFVSKSRS